MTLRSLGERGDRQPLEARSWVGGGEVMESEEAEEERATLFSSGKWELGAGDAQRRWKAEAMGKVRSRSTDDEDGQTRMDMTRGALVCKEFAT